MKGSGAVAGVGDQSAGTSENPSTPNSSISSSSNEAAGAAVEEDSGKIKKVEEDHKQTKESELDQDGDDEDKGASKKV